ncbi:thioredoxin family protein [Bacillus cereus]|uniref:thioredoxin family protein n=1 Tax=Bacillota TaxID=1239 RepID=UPI00214A1142|nr:MULTISPECIES: thioredoxin family protein [Bacillota]MCR1952754.1 thioredoxin family protein [Clostridium sp. DSM 100503]MCR2013811.1 thioredoxin family protein [Bacillus cereus]
MEELIMNNPISIVYFSGSTCGACDAIKEKILYIIKDYNEIKFLEINAIENKVLASRNDIFSLPILLLFINGKETLRFGRYFDILEFKNSINRYYNLIYK